ncbi:MAG: hypothetical protein PVJ04_11800 [Gemmatimonadota bacterium]
MIILGHPGARARGLAALVRGVSLGVCSVLLLSSLASGQEDPSIQILEPEYQQAQAEYEAAFRALEALEGRLTQALEDVDEARAAGDEARTDQGYDLVLQLSADLRLQRQRVDEKAEELRDARTSLLQALRRRVDELLAEVDSARDDSERSALAAILQDVNNRRLEILAEEDPETVLEPMRDITISPTDLPIDIRRKAATLDYRAEQHEARLEGIDQRLEELGQDLRRSRFVSDFLSGVERYGDTQLPVGRPGSQITPPTDPEQRPPGADSLAVETRPMTLEERIQRLEELRTELEERIQLIRAKAERFRALAGGGGGE